MRSSWLWTAAAAVTLAAPAAAQEIPHLTLAPGEAVTVDTAKAASTPQRSKAEWTRLDLYAARHLSGTEPPDAPVPVGTALTGPTEIKPEPVPPGLVRIRFHSIAGRHSLLVVENGLPRALAYRARMTFAGETKPTDVCFVPPGLPSYEHWPHPIERLELTAFQHVPWQPGQQPTCK